ncbi:MAG: ATP-binding cassette domain-containing protein [Candidatus Dadabacteria bacterium]|nr:MAG: ATP-binding cassette domain-containing protein [Candidatus Dadabacteria bacterium]
MLEIINLHKSFGSQKVLAGVNLVVKEHQLIAVVGPSGVGKSVLLKIIMGLLSPDKGEIKLGNMCKEKEADPFCIATLFQTAALLDSLTLYENIALPLKEHTSLSKEEIHQKVVKLVQELSLEREVFKYPQDVSIGVRKRAGLARALIGEPKIVLIDEPTTGLDPFVGQEVYDLINYAREKWNITGIVVSHEIPEVFQVIDKVAMLLNGEIIFFGTAEEFLNSENPAIIQFREGKEDGPIRINW